VAAFSNPKVLFEEVHTRRSDWLATRINWEAFIFVDLRVRQEKKRSS
jgi:hypothetical protein